MDLRNFLIGIDFCIHLDKIAALAQGLYELTEIAKRTARHRFPQSDCCATLESSNTGRPSAIRRRTRLWS
jgi:hypothetical protein